MKKIIIEFEEINRATGRTTRLVDEAIQKLFNGGPVLVVDHFNHSTANRYFLERIERRLHNEHPHIKYQVKKSMGTNYYIIELI